MRFVRCRTTSGYEAMILTPEQAYVVLLNLQEPERTITLLASGTASAYQNVWACNGKTSVSLMRRFTFVGHGRAAKLACRKAKLRSVRCHCIRCWLNLCFAGSRRHCIRKPLIECFLQFDCKANSHVLQTCLSRIDGQLR